jgi:putative redox protein
MMNGNLRRVDLSWTGNDLQFEGGPEGGPRISVDGDSSTGPSPTELLLLSLAGCMAVDMKVILEKSRVTLEGMDVELEGERAPTDPKRYVALRMTFRLHGPEEADEGKIARAVELSRDKYCSVFHTLRPDIDVEIRTERA